MTTFEKILAAAETVGIPAYPGVYNGDAKIWITYNLDTETGDAFGDDGPTVLRRTVQAHLYCPETYNPAELIKLFRTALYRQDVTYPSLSDLGIESDSRYRHLVFEFEDISDI